MCILIVSSFSIFFFYHDHNNKYVSNDKIKLSNGKIFNLVDQPFLGKKDAKNIIVEFSDYRCPWCGKFQKDMYPLIKQRLVKTGKAKFYYVNLTVLGPNSYKAANAAAYIYKHYPEHFFKFHDILFSYQKNEKKNWVTDKLLLNVAKKSIPNLNENKFIGSIKNKEYMNQIKSLDSKITKIGIRVTPTLIVNGKVSNPFEYKSIQNKLITE
nr:DsbA family protein [Sporolactobacillus spathodeae]